MFPKFGVIILNISGDTGFGHSKTLKPIKIGENVGNAKIQDTNPNKSRI